MITTSMIALYLAAGVATLLVYGAVAALSYCFTEWLWPGETASDRQGAGMAAAVWPVTLPVALTAGFAIWVVARVAAWQDARKLPRAQVFRG